MGEYWICKEEIWECSNVKERCFRAWVWGVSFVLFFSRDFAGERREGIGELLLEMVGRMVELEVLSPKQLCRKM